MATPEALRALVGTRGTPQVARQPVNAAAIADWCDAMGVDPASFTTRAPAAMLDVWDRPGLAFRRDPDSPRGRALDLLEVEGYTAVVAVNSELTIERDLEIGDLVQSIEILDAVSEEKETALGAGFFVTTRHRYETDAGEHVGDLVFRILKFRPGTGRTATVGREPPDPDPALRPRPAVNKDNAFFWDGAREHELRVQRCRSCERLSSPPVTRCPRCGGFDMDHVVSRGRGTLYSYAVPHFPQVPGFRYPLLVGLVELEEGVRVVANVIDCDRDDLAIGMPLELTWLDGCDPPLPQFRPAPTDDRLPVLEVPVTTTLIVSGAVATRDYTAVHHDRDAAQAAGSRDIFMNINTTVGLVQRYVEEWVREQGLAIRAIKVRLGVPNHPGDTMTFTGRRTGPAAIAVRGRNRAGDHVTATVEVEPR